MMIVTFQDLDNVSIAGRLGNNLFQIAAVIGTARRNNCDYVFPPWRYNQFLAHPLPTSERIYAPRIIREQQDYHYQEINLNYFPCNTDLKGYFQSYKYFDFIRSEIKERFEFKTKYAIVYADHLMSPPTCAIHVRHGDYLIKPHVHPIQDMDYYLKAKDIIKGIDPSVKYMVFSDNLEWCKDHHLGDYYGGTNEVKDLSLMIACRYHIIANSSFSWWAAYLSNSKHVIAPWHWSGVVSDTADLILPEWERI